ncbi:MAG TPA: HD domain-containing protein [Thermomicrobiales bacterium]|nr:HD domain-containing protein [Thermomicrobiales bacterium]
MTAMHLRANRSQSPIAVVRYRLSQALVQVFASRRETEVPESLAAIIHGAIAIPFARLSIADRTHLESTAIKLRDAGWDGDVVAAGLLHDIGKAAHGPGPTVIDRGVWVLLKRTWPSLATRIANCEGRPLAGAGLWRLARHAESGATMLHAAGYNDRVCWLVRNHERSDLGDPGLRALIAADDARPIPVSGARQ